MDLPPSSELDLKLDQLGESTEFSVEGIEGDWFDDDFWTSADSKKKQQQLKAEEERIAAEVVQFFLDFPYVFQPSSVYKGTNKFLDM